MVVAGQSSERAQRATRQKSGLTLVELLFVLVVVGVFVEFALPKMSNVLAEARTAKVSALAAVLRIAAVQVRGLALTRGVSCGASVPAGQSPVVVEGHAIALHHCYPQAPSDPTTIVGSVLEAANIHPALEQVSLVISGTAPATQLELRLPDAPLPGQCATRYHPPAAEGGAPAFSLETSGC